MRIFIDANLLIYLNTLGDSQRHPYQDFYSRLTADNRLFTDVIVLDELLHVSKKRYDIPYGVTNDFIENIVLPETEIMNLGLADYVVAIDLLGKSRMNPSDALHLASMKQNDIKNIASEDHEFDKVQGITRIWLS